MSNILEEGENIEVNFDAAAVELSSPSVEKDSKPVSGRRFLPFSFRRSSAATEDPSSPPAAIAVPSPSSSCHDDDDDDELEIDEEPGMYLNHSNSHRRTRSYIYEEEPEVPPSTERDDRNLTQAESLENLLGSAMRRAEEDTGATFFAFSRVSREDAVELGKRVSTFSDIRAMIAPVPPPVLEDDEASVHTVNTHATETSFIKVPPMDPGSVPQDFWTGIMRMMSLDNDDSLPVLPIPDKEGSAQPSSTPSESKGAEEQNQEQTASPPRTRRWDKLRCTFVAQENGLTVGHEAQADSQLPKTKSPPRKPIMGKVQRKSVATKERSIKTKKSSKAKDFSLALGPVPKPPTAPEDELEERVFDVNIRVEDLSKEHDDQISDCSSCSSVDSSVDEDEASVEEPPVEKSFDPDEAESMEVVYLIPDNSSGKGDVLPPFPSKIFGAPSKLTTP